MKKMISIATIILIVLFMFVPNNSLALVAGEGGVELTPEIVGQQIANWAIQFCNDEDDGKYTCLYNDNTNDSNGSPRSIAYNAKIVEGATYEFDCVGWVSFAIHHATGIGYDSFTIFASPTRYGFNNVAFGRGFFEEVWRNDAGVEGLPTDVTVLPGDILIMNGHVGLYVGKNSEGVDMVADMWSTANGGLGIRSATTFTNAVANDNLKQIGRVTEEAARNANFQFVADGVYLPGSIGSGGSSTSNNFEFNGLPNNVSYSSSQDNLWLFDLISQFFGFFAGMMINLLKYSIIGYIEMAESIANIFLQSTTESLSQVNDIEYAAVQYVDEYSLRCY